MSNCLYTFLDEGGNFDFSPRGTRYFILTSVTTRRPFQFHSILDSYKHDCLEYGLNTEYFHCAEDNTYVKRKLFAIIANHINDIRIDSLIIEKSKVELALQDGKRFYPEMLGRLLRHVFYHEMKNPLEKIIVITDTIPIQKKRHAIEKTIKGTLNKMLPPEIRYRLLHHTSRSHYGLQVADYCNWAVFRKWQKEKREGYDYIKQALRSELNMTSLTTPFGESPLGSYHQGGTFIS